MDTAANKSTDAPEMPAEAPTRVLLHMPVDVRSASIALIALLVGIQTLHWAAAVAIPVLLGLIFSYALSPAVDVLEQWRVPRWVGAALMVMSVIGGLAGTAFALADDAAQLVESLPAAAQKLRETLKDRSDSSRGALDTVQSAAAQLEQAANENAATGPAYTTKGVTKVQIVRAKFNIQDYLWTGTMGLVGFVRPDGRGFAC